MIRIIFFGTPEFSATVLAGLLAHPDKFQVCAVVTQPDRPAGRGNKLTASPVKEIALKHNLPIFQPLSVRKDFEAFKSWAANLGPFDIGVVVAFGQILPQAALDLPHAGCVNIHASLLPRWRGAAPIQRALMAGDSETGVCLMRMEAGLDTGGVFAQSIVPIRESDTSGSLFSQLAIVGTDLLVNKLHEIAQGTLQAVPQREQGVTLASKISNDECRIDWSLSNQEVDRKIRSLSPAPGAFTTLSGERLKIYAGTAQSATKAGRPGEVLDASATGIAIACGNGCFIVKELQLAGKKRCRADEFLRGVELANHTILGAS